MNKLENPLQNDIAGPAPRHRTTQVMIGNVAVGGGAPIVVQSMTNTDTADVQGTVDQITRLANTGSEMVRITVDREEAAAAVPHIRDGLRKRGITVPLIGDFHYIGHKLLAEYPACAEALDKYRINPGNVGFKNKRDSQFADIVEIAIKNNKAVRIGANWGSLDQELLTKLMEENANSATPRDARAVTREAMVQSALLSAARAEEIGLPKNKMVLSAKVSSVQDLIAVYQDLAARSDYAIHLGLTEAGMGSKGIVASSAALGILLQQGIGDTIRISLTPEPGGDRTLEVVADRQNILGEFADGVARRLFLLFFQAPAHVFRLSDGTHILIVFAGKFGGFLVELALERRDHFAQLFRTDETFQALQSIRPGCCLRLLSRGGWLLLWGDLFVAHRVSR